MTVIGKVVAEPEAMHLEGPPIFMPNFGFSVNSAYKVKVQCSSDPEDVRDLLCLERPMVGQFGVTMGENYFSLLKAMFLEKLTKKYTLLSFNEILLYVFALNVMIADDKNIGKHISEYGDDADRPTLEQAIHIYLEKLSLQQLPPSPSHDGTPPPPPPTESTARTSTPSE